VVALYQKSSLKLMATLFSSYASADAGKRQVLDWDRTFRDAQSRGSRGSP
jgi:hypothetical protein